jgi:hypothetical protein
MTALARIIREISGFVESAARVELEEYRNATVARICGCFPGAVETPASVAREWTG